MDRNKIKKIPVIGYLLRVFVGIIRLPKYFDLLREENMTLQQELFVVQEEFKREQIEYKKDVEKLNQEQIEYKKNAEKLNQEHQKNIQELKQWNYDLQNELRELKNQMKEGQLGHQKDIEELRQWNYGRMEEIRALQNIALGDEYIKKLNIHTSIVPTIWGDEVRLHIAKTASVGSCFFNTNSGNITIGEYTYAGSNVSILAGSHDMQLTGLLRRDVEITQGCDIKIGNGVWLGSNCTVLGPVTIGDNAVIAAGAVVTPGTVVPGNAVYGGVPAKHMRDIDFFEGSDADNPAVRKALERNQGVLFAKGWTEKREMYLGHKKYIGHYQIEDIAMIYTNQSRLVMTYILRNIEKCDISVRMQDKPERVYSLCEPSGTIELILDNNKTKDSTIDTIYVERKTKDAEWFLCYEN